MKHPSPQVGAADWANVVTGSNGTFADACDADGDLIEATCENFEDYEPAGERQFYTVWTETGAVVLLPVDCGGRCVDGRCPVSCPMIGDWVRAQRIEDESVRLRACKDGFEYDCAINSAPVPRAGCHAMLAVGELFEIRGRGGWSSSEQRSCAGPLVAIGLTDRDAETCSLVDCRLEVPIVRAGP